jgi:ABC-type ATPase with predicted acetyltransferase domain
MMATGENSARATIVARWFGVDPGDDPYRQHESLPQCEQGIEPIAGQVILITGPSGAGKSTLLWRLRARYRRPSRWIDLGGVRLADRAVVDCVTDRLPRRAFSGEEARIAAGLELLSRVGLGEVWTYLRRPAELSEGQRWRLRVAVGLARAMHARWGLTVLMADEFCALLDRVTAMVVARALRKAVDAATAASRQVCAVVATSHEDLAGALRPNVVIGCDFGRASVLRASL